jgi:hypothetical protein
MINFQVKDFIPGQELSSCPNQWNYLAAVTNKLPFSLTIPLKYLSFEGIRG